MKSMGKWLPPLLALFVGLLIGLHKAGLNPFMDPPPALISEIVLEDVDGVVQHGEQWLGKVVLVNHWASWCPPCVKEIPLLVDAQQQMGPNGLQVVGIAHDVPEAARTFGDQMGVNYPSLVITSGGSELMIRQGNPQGSALPYTAVFDRNGMLAKTWLGALDADDINALVKPLL